MGKLIIITGPQGCGKSTFARENYPDAYILDYDSNNLFWKIKTLLKRNKQVVVCCLPMDINEVLKPSKFDEYKIITLNSKGEVAQICGRGFRTNVVAEGGSNFFKINIEDFSKQVTNEQQLSFHRSEVERIEKLIEEENKPKVGDWVNMDGLIFKFNEHLVGEFKKITNPELIKLLEDECRESI